MTERDERAARRAAMTRRHDEAAAEGEAEAEAELELPSTSAADAAQQESMNQARLLADMSEQLAKMKVKLSSFNANMLKREAAMAERQERVAKQEVLDREHNERVLREAATVAARARAQADDMAKMAAQLNAINGMVVEPTANILSLPVELRAHIYRFVLGEPSRNVRGERTRRKGVSASTWLIKDGRPPLAEACKTIRHELLPLFYAETVFNLVPLQVAEATRSLLSAWERSMGHYALNLRLLEVNSCVSSCSCCDRRIHPTKSGLLLHAFTFQTTAKLTIQGTIEVNCSVISGVEDPSLDEVEDVEDVEYFVEPYCACHPRRVGQASSAQGVDGHRLFGLAAVCMEEECPHKADEVCQECKLPTMDITAAAVVDIDDSE
ncbi:hypothetical protein LTR56_002360 [Elasticomyces elasticus]|nr:hypothetical protein LTR56_002360 [Elasticomyces elasticus]KAK3665924.1 hypothetical protein LTR22_003243 [Elasticomyces elasticus]KAK4929396.1 hypothetical protein LTR49_004000 [Elasticomyces elasticus]KAK5764685.1 hypothetical protein LTS12_005186 [Elasticomyces elasticus]